MSEFMLQKTEQSLGLPCLPDVLKTTFKYADSLQQFPKDSPILFEYLLLISLALALGLGVWIGKREFVQKLDFGPKLALIELTDLVRKTWESLVIVTDMAPIIYMDLTFLSEVRAALHRGVAIRILYYPEKESKKCVNLFQKMSEVQTTGSIIIKKLHERWPYHFWVSDGKHVRLEYPHRPCDASQVQGHLIYNALKVGTKFSEFFDTLWEMP